MKQQTLKKNKILTVMNKIYSSEFVVIYVVFWWNDKSSVSPEMCPIVCTGYIKRVYPRSLARFISVSETIEDFID